MLAVKSVNVRDNFKEWCDKINMGETVVISRPRNENIYMISEAEYNALQKAKKNAEYLAKIDESIENHKKGDTISFTMEELQAMESEDWKPTQKVLEFERTHNIQRR
jgi:antitoxin YefM